MQEFRFQIVPRRETIVAKKVWQNAELVLVLIVARLLQTHQDIRCPLPPRKLADFLRSPRLIPGAYVLRGIGIKLRGLSDRRCGFEIINIVANDFARLRVKDHYSGFSL